MHYLHRDFVLCDGVQLSIECGESYNVVFTF